MKNYLAEYAVKPVRKFQQGGNAPAPAPADPAAAQGGQGGNQIEQMLMQVIQSQDAQLALQFCNALAQQMGIQGGAPAQGQPASAPAPEGGLPAGRYGMSTKILLKKPASLK